MTNPNLDPIGFVLDEMWKDFARNGDSMMLELRAALATRDYPLALTIALAIELNAAKTEPAGNETNVLKKLAAVEQYAFNCRNLLETPNLPRARQPPIPTITREDIDKCLKPVPTRAIPSPAGRGVPPSPPRTTPTSRPIIP